MPLSDKALSVFAFAAYHQLESGQTVTSVVRRDGNGHSADPQAVEELTAAGLASATEEEISFQGDAPAILTKVVEAIRQAGAR